MGATRIGRAVCALHLVGGVVGSAGQGEQPGPAEGKPEPKEIQPKCVCHSLSSSSVPGTLYVCICLYV